MSKLVVYRASAGTGKTFRLAAEYIKQVISKPDSFGSILAVTFTNKATAEMKGRILNELFALSQGEDTPMKVEIMKDLRIPEDILRTKAKQALSLILHDYSRFAISTIDSFVQRVIQALLWEIGEQGGVDIELDTQPVLEHAADNLIDSAAKLDDLMKWLTSMGHSLMDEGQSWDVRRKLIELGKQIFSEKFRLMDYEDIQKFTDKQRVDQLKNSLSNLISSIISEIKSLAQNAYNELDARNIDPNSFLHGNKGVMGIFNKTVSLDNSSKELPDTKGVRIQNALNDPTGEAWVKKETLNNKQQFSPIEAVIKEVLHPSLVRIIETIETKIVLFNSAKLILKNLENLALIGDLWNKVRELSREEGFLLLSDSSHLLKEFVKESDTPFIYEKVGTRYEVFMIDEFQDTSEVQWHNFKPLINNSLSQGNFSMIVGDVKQSIYRWRNGDWSILATGVETDFQSFGIEEKFLKVNRRSLPKIIEFNNAFFEKAKDKAVEVIESSTIDSQEELLVIFKEQIKKAYKDVRQEIPDYSNPNNGFVEVKVKSTKNNSEYSEYLSGELPALICQLRDRFELGDIAILLRSNREGQNIANIFLEYNRSEPDQSKHIAFVSQDGLLLKSSPIVRLIVAAIRLVQDQANEIAKRVLAKELATIKAEADPNWHYYFSDLYLSAEIDWLNTLNTRPLQEVFEAIANRYHLFKMNGELAHLAELHEHISSLSAKGIGDVNRFLSWWEQKSSNLSLSVPNSSNALSILTIHKSKGLQFPVVIIPYASWPFRQTTRPPLLWVDTNEEPFNILPKYPIHATKEGKNSLFARDIFEEEMKEIVDNINLLYVAFTRPEKELFVYVPLTTGDNTDNALKINPVSNLINGIVPYLELTEMVVDNQEGSSTIRFGEPTSLNQEKKEESNKENSWVINEYPVGESFRDLKLKLEAEDFFLSYPSERFAPLKHGKLMHELFSKINTTNDVDQAIQDLMVNGLFDRDESEDLSNKILDLINVEPLKSWFSGEWVIKTEASILTPNGHSYRPDRVMIKDNHAVVIDFKFGDEHSSHQKQVKRYMKLLSDIGYSPVNGYVWYVDENRLIELD